MEQVKPTDIFLKALKKHSRERFTYDDDTEEENMIKLFEVFGDDVDGFYYIRDMEYLFKAVSFYMMFSTDHVETKLKVQEVFEHVIKNDTNYKEISDYLFIFRDALSDVYDELKGTDENK